MRSQIFLVLALAGCASTRADAPTASWRGPSLNDPKSMSLVGRFGIGHACPVNGMIFTAAHVATSPKSDPSQAALGYVYSMGTRKGFVTGFSPLLSRDLATMNVDIGDQPTYGRLAGRAPVNGDKIYWQEFNLTANPLRGELRSGEITDVTTGHFVFKPEPSPGASGGCVINEQGEVYGIVIWGIGLGPRRGVGVILSGEWWPG